MLLDGVFHFQNSTDISISSRTSDDVRMSTAAIFHLPRRLFGRQPKSFESLREENAPKEKAGEGAGVARGVRGVRARDGVLLRDWKEL